MSNATSLPLTYADLVCVDDLDPNALETSSDLESLEQDVYHVILEEPASNPDDQDRGLGVQSLLSGDAGAIATVPRLVEAELLKDERIDQVRAQLILVPTGGQFSDGTAAPLGGYELAVAYVPAGSVVPSTLSFGFTASGGLVAL